MRGLAAAKAVSPRQQQTTQERAATHHIGACCFSLQLLSLLLYIAPAQARACAYSHICLSLVLAVLQVIPQLQGDATDQTPPDLPSYLFKERIVYLVRPGPGFSSVLSIIPNRALQRWPGSVDDNDLCCLQGMSLVPAVTELLLAELLYLQYDNPTRPIFMYINSAGVQVRSYGHACSTRVFSKWASLKAVTEQTVVSEVAMEQR